MRRMSMGLLAIGACAISRVAFADLPNTAPIYGAPDSLEAVGASLEQSVSARRQNDPQSALRDEAEGRLRANGDAMSVALGSMATSIGTTLLTGGIAFAASANWSAQDCPTCLPSVVLVAGGFQLLVLGVFNLADYGSLHVGRHHARHVDALATAMSHPSIEAAHAARRGRLTLGWSLFASGALLFASSIAFVAMGRQPGFDDDARIGIAAVNAFAGGWLATLGTSALATKWTDELALAPVRW